MLHFKRGGSGPSLVLLHGFLGGSAYWKQSMEAWQVAFDVIAPDLPGFGGSAAESPAASIAAMAHSVLGLLDALELESFLLLGHSMGGMVAQQLALDAPGRVMKLVLYGTASRGALPGRFESMEESIARLEQDGVAASARRIAATWFVNGEAAADYEMCAAAGSRATPAAASAALRALSRWDISARLGEIGCPALVITGDRDRSCTPDHAYELARGLPRADLCILPRCAHAAHLEAPQLFIPAVSRFIVGD